MEKVGYERRGLVFKLIIIFSLTKEIQVIFTHTETLQCSLYTGIVGGAVVATQQLKLWVTDKEVKGAVKLLMKALNPLCFTRHCDS